MNDSFLKGFEKKANIQKEAIGFIRRLAVPLIRGVKNVGKSISHKGLDVATKPGVSNTMSNIGKGIHHTGNWIAKNPGKAGLLGAGAVAAGGATLADGGSSDRNNTMMQGYMMGRAGRMY